MIRSIRMQEDELLEVALRREADVQSVCYAHREWGEGLEIGSFSDFNTSQERRAVSNEIFSDDDKSVSNNSLDSYNRLWITSGAKASTLNSSQIEIVTVGRRRNDAACPTNRGGNETRNSYMNQQRQAMGDRSIAMDDLDKASVKNQNNDTVVSDVDFGDELGFGTDYC